MKKILLIVFLFLACGTLNAEAQNAKGANPDMRERFYALQCEQISRELNLEGERKTAFTKLYTEYLNTSQQLKQQYALGPGRGTKRSDITNEDIEKHTLDSFEMSIKAIEIRRDYYKKFREILSPREINRVYDTERRLRERIEQEQSDRNQRRR